MSENSGRRLSELATLYEAARSLIGARDREQAAARLVYSAMGALGVRSGALLALEDSGRCRVLHAAGLGVSTEGLRPRIPQATRDWILRERAFDLDERTPALGPLRERLREDLDGAVAAAIAGGPGLLGLLVLGPPLLPGESGGRDLALLEALASLAAPALQSRPARPRARAGETRPARTLAEIRRRHPPLRGLVGASPALVETCRDLLAVAGTRYPVLLLGESGSGKELAAHALHGLSDRAAGPFEAVDCGAIPRELIESELFGHVRGAFTGAHRDRRGAFELAHRGTLFLDEIGEMPLQLQTRLLRVIQEGRLRRVGGEHSIEIDVRIAAATHRDLRRQVAEGRFREDLYYRLAVFTVRLPALRDRPGDLEPLVRHFLAAPESRRDVPWKVEPAVLEALAAHTWPGNVRELANLCSALTVDAEEPGRIALADLERAWRRQHGDDPPPWHRAAPPRGALGGWVVDQARAARFNLVDAARALSRRRRAGEHVPLTERSALGYYLTGEILRALVAHGGDERLAARSLAGGDELAARLLPRVRKVGETLRAGRAGLERRFPKLPAEYGDDLERARAMVEEG